MNFKEYLEKLNPLKDFGVKITLNNGDTYLVENIAGKQGSLRVLQNHLGEKLKTTRVIDLTYFGEFYEEWKDDNNKHPTIGFLDRYNKEGGIIERVD